MRFFSLIDPISSPFQSPSLSYDETRQTTVVMRDYDSAHFSLSCALPFPLTLCDGFVTLPGHVCNNSCPQMNLLVRENRRVIVYVTTSHYSTRRRGGGGFNSSPLLIPSHCTKWLSNQYQIISQRSICFSPSRLCPSLPSLSPPPLTRSD